MTIPTGSQLESEHTPTPTELDQVVGGGEVAGRSPSRLAWERFRRDKLLMVAFTITVIFLIIAILAPILDKLGVLDPESPHPELLDGYYPKGNFYGITLHHPLGVEPGIGRDLLSRVLLGTTLSLTIALSGAIITVAIGMVLGIVGGFSGGWVDWLIGRVVDLTLAFPQTLMLLALSQVLVDRLGLGFHLGPLHLFVPQGSNGSLVNGAYIVVVLSLFGWPPVARLIRGQVLTLREREFVDAAVLMGASRFRLYFKEILPNLWAPLLVYFTLLMPAYVSAEAALSFLGVGIRPPTPTLGNVLNSALLYQDSEPVYFFAPAIFIALLVISFNLLGDGARDALDPKSRR